MKTILKRLFTGLLVAFLTIAVCVPTTYATFPGNNGKILYEKSDGFYTIHTDGSHETKLNIPSQYFKNPTWSPDGTKIAYQSVSAPENFYRVFTMDASGTNQTVISPAYSGNPQWLPDSLGVVYDTIDIHNSENVTTNKSFMDGSGTTIAQNYGAGILSPDGNMGIYYFDEMYDRVAIAKGLHTASPINAAGASYEQILEYNTTQWEVICVGWSADSRLAMITERDTLAAVSKNTVKFVNITTKQVEKTIEIGGYTLASCPVASPDGKNIAFSLYDTEEDYYNWNSLSTKTMYKVNLQSGQKAALSTGVSSIYDWQAITPPNVYRFWSDQSRHHFYTASKEEALYVISNYPQNVWRLEGVAYSADSLPVCTNGPKVHRFWSSQYGTHFYTVSEQEKQHVIDSYDDTIWQYEGIAYYVY